jgi:hypothetical protein
LDLDYEQAFKIDVTKFQSSVSGIRKFCWAYPSIIDAKQGWIINYPSPSDGKEPQYDNSLFLSDYYFFLDSLSFNIMGIQNLEDPSTRVEIYSTIPPNSELVDKEPPWFLYDETNKLFFIVNSKQVISY